MGAPGCLGAPPSGRKERRARRQVDMGAAAPGAGYEPEIVPEMLAVAPPSAIEISTAVSAPA